MPVVFISTDTISVSLKLHPVNSLSAFSELNVNAAGILNAADGTPRMINKYCNQSMLIGDSSKANIITTDIVMQAINDCELG